MPNEIISHHKRTVKDISKVAFSNIMNLFAGVLVGFLLPKIIGVTDYGYYKIFTLYAGYVGLFHFGIEDGIYLLFGDKDYYELDKLKFRLYTKFLFFLELIISLIFVAISLLLLTGEARFIFTAIAIYLLSNNMTNYYQFISQITRRFNEFSLRNILKSLFTGLSVIFLWIIHHLNGTLLSYKIFTIIFVAINILLTFWYVFSYHDITFGVSSKFKDEKKDLLVFLKIGFPLMIANLCSTLILTIDRQFVSILYDTDTYAVYAFAYNMLALVTTATSAISVVIYPTLKRASEKMLKKNYSNLVSLILVFIFGCLILYFPLSLFIEWFLPKYQGSLIIFRIIFPGLAISATISIVMQNYYKTLGLNLKFFFKSIFILALSIALNFFAYYIFKTTISISIVSVAALIVWYCIVEYYFVINFKIKWIKNLVYLFSMVAGFYLITIIKNNYIGMACYFVLFLVVTFVFYLKEFKKIIEKIKMSRKNKLS